MIILKFTKSGNDWSSKVVRRGYGFARNDLDSEKTTRTKAGVMRRDKIASKLTLSFEAFNLSRAELAALDSDLSDATFSATVLTLNGEQTKKFYCSSFKVSLDEVCGGKDFWGNATFNLIEV